MDRQRVTIFGAVRHLHWTLDVPVSGNSAGEECLSCNRVGAEYKTAVVTNCSGRRNIVVTGFKFHRACADG